MSKSASKPGGIKTILATLVIPIAFIISYLVWQFVMGNPDHFEGGDNSLLPLPANVVGGFAHYMGVMYKGGYMVPVLITLFITVVTFSIERYITIGKSKGKGRVESFIMRIRNLVASENFSAAHAECEKQGGSVANVVSAGLKMYDQMVHDKDLDKERKILAIQKELEEATTLELPMLSKNLVIISTIASIATLAGLLGTVFGMIRAFAALANAGAPDAVALSTGISEALVNTALGILTSTIAIIMYNFYTNKIDAITYGIDEAGYTIVQTFAAKN